MVNDETTLRRLRMRSMRRGIREMDLILGAFAAERLETLSADDLPVYEDLLSENDQDLYRWVSGQEAPPEKYSDLVSQIEAHMVSRGGV